MVEAADDPFFAVLAEQLIEPCGLFLVAFIAVEHNDAYALVDDCVAGFLKFFGAVFGESEGASPVPAELWSVF